MPCLKMGPLWPSRDRPGQAQLLWRTAHALVGFAVRYGHAREHIYTIISDFVLVDAAHIDAESVAVVRPPPASPSGFAWNWIPNGREPGFSGGTVWRLFGRAQYRPGEILSGPCPSDRCYRGDRRPLGETLTVLTGCIGGEAWPGRSIADDPFLQ